VIFEESGGVRGRKVRAGEGMLTPVAPTRIDYADGTSELLVPGVSRFAIEHELVQWKPEAFVPCMKRGDRMGTSQRFAELLRAADRAVERQLAEARGERPPRKRASIARTSIPRTRGKGNPAWYL
jgi:hypothetical protein